MKVKTNDFVVTPYGEGYVQGFAVKDRGVIVRLPINSVTSPLLGESFGTRYAKHSGLWLFDIDVLTPAITHQSHGHSRMFSSCGKRVSVPDGRPSKVERVPKPDAAKMEGFSAMLRRMHVDDASEDDIMAAAVSHPKYSGNPRKARAYATSFIRKLKG